MSHSHANMLPRGALVLAGTLVGLSLAVVSAARIAHLPPTASPAALRGAERVAPAASRDLRFIDRADGAVTIVDVGEGRPAAVIEPGSNSGFIRGVMRGFARERRMYGLGDAKPFRLTAWRDGELSLTDAATGRSVELSAFGATNRAAFAALLKDAR